MTFFILDDFPPPWPYPRKQEYGDKAQSPEKLLQDENYVDLTQLMLDVQTTIADQKAQLANWKTQTKESLGKFARESGSNDSAMDQWISDLLTKLRSKQSSSTTRTQETARDCGRSTLLHKIKNKLTAKWNEKWYALYEKEGRPPVDVIDKIDVSNLTPAHLHLNSFIERRLDIDYFQHCDAKKLDALVQETWDRYLATRFRKESSRAFALSQKLDDLSTSS